MVFILLSWIYIFITSLNFGILFKKIVGIKNCHSIIHHILGLFFITLITSFAAFFTRINSEFYITILVLNFVIFFTSKTAFKQEIISLKNIFISFNFYFKLLFIGLFIITLAQSATKPYLIDNESYYIQTIKWVNEYGYVKGLSNLHPFFAQNSAWHTLQAAFNFPFLTNLLNDLNGFVFVLISFLAVEMLNNFKSTNDKQGFCFGLILLFTLFLMQFISSPSPDLLVFTLTLYVFYLFLNNFKKINSDSFKIILSIALFLCLVKVTIAIIVIPVIVLFIKNFKLLKNNLPSLFLLSFVVLTIFIFKNILISGYLLFPIESLDVFDFDWKQPKSLIEFYNNGTYMAGFNNENVSQLSQIERFWFWLNSSKLHGLFNKLYILLLFVFPFIIYKEKRKVPFIFIYSLALAQFIILWNNSPQYRFFFVFIIFLTIQIVITIIHKKKFLIILTFLSVFISAIPIFIEVNLNHFTTNSFALKLSTFKAKNIFVPEKTSKKINIYSKENIEGFQFNSPNQDAFFWSTGDGSLPCVNKKQLNYFKKHYKFVPQLRTGNLKDGFRSIKIEE